MKKDGAEAVLEIPSPGADLERGTGKKAARSSEEVLQPKQNILDLVTRETQESRKLNGVVIGELVGFSESGAPLVEFPTCPSDSTVARSTVGLEESAIGREVALMFERGDPRRPIVMGLIQHPKKEQTESKRIEKHSPIEAEIDDERLVFTAKKEIVLRCGKATITLTRAGKVLIRGAYLVSHASGVNRIRGGSVQIN